jgi:DeoR/GlpR family transcriptional regulator of sugar metabolism
MVKKIRAIQRGVMLTTQRKAEILRRLKADGQFVAKSFSQELGLSEDTIRRDLRELAAEGLLQRVHGGALPASPAVAGFAERLQVVPEGKSKIGRVAAGMIRPGQIVFLDGGTTAAQVARHLSPDLKATIVTHSPSVAMTLVDYPGVEVEVIGGRLFKHSVVTVGALAVEAVQRVRPDLFFMGVTGVHPEQGLTTGDAEEAAMKRTICRLSGETVVLASHEKLGAMSPYPVIGLEEVDTVLTDGEASPLLRARMTELGVALIRC